MARMQILKPSKGGKALAGNKQEDGSALVWAANMAHKYENTGVELLRIVKGAGAGKMKMKTNAPDQYDLELPDREVTIPANSDEIYEPFSPEAHNERDGADKGFTSIEFDNIAGLNVTVIRPGAKVR